MHIEILARIESLGFSTSVHREAGCCELMAVKMPSGQPVYSVRVDGDSEKDVYRAACELAEMLGVELDG